MSLDNNLDKVSNLNNTLYLPVSVETMEDLPKIQGSYLVNDGTGMKELTYYLEIPDKWWYGPGYYDFIKWDKVKVWLKPLSLEEVRDYLARVQGNDLASVASHTSAVGNSIGQ